MRDLAIVAVLVVAVALGACASKPKTNAQKCQAMGGTYNAITKSCQLQSE